MELAKEKKETKRNGKMKSVASIPDNYVSILQLQERWNKDKERKQKEREIVERGVKEKVNNVQGRREGKDAIEEPIEKDGVEVSAIVSKKDEDGGDSRERKKKLSKKKVNKKNHGGSVEEVVKCGSNNPVKEETPGEKIVQNRENSASDLIGVEEDGRVRGVNGHVRLNGGEGYYRNQKHDWSSTRVIKASRTMVWVKKGHNDAAGGKH
ncbi:DNA ligase-like protein [Hirschfeldia incana]|nr:DNA ligase-like protein [Hirschfeldia incana]